MYFPRRNKDVNHESNYLLITHRVLYVPNLSSMRAGGFSLISIYMYDACLNQQGKHGFVVPPNVFHSKNLLASLTLKCVLP